MAKIETVSYSNEAFKNYLMKLSKDIIWKNSSLANQYETSIDPYLAELYITAHRGVLNWDVIRAFPRAVLKMIGVNEIDIDAYASNKQLIPESLRASAVEEYQNALCSTNPSTGHHGYETGDGWVTVYEEANDYYRMLNGLPGVNDTNFVYNTDSRWPTDTPVHELSLIDRLEMEEAGILDKLYQENPSAKYLKYCGSKMIDIYKARVANRFDILWRNSVDSTTLENDFDAVYESCCNLVNSVYYSDAFKKTNRMYENFLAMCILFMTIQTMQYHYLSVDVIRDFYDTESLKYVYDSYSVPFYNEIPLEYHRKIVKNINKLIGYKGSSQVFFDLFDIFDTNMAIYTYYITKVHRFDEHGNPTFEPLKDENGNIVYDDKGNPVLDPNNYEIAFSRGEIYQDPALSVSDPVNKSEYEMITVSDPYWVEDANIQKVLSDSDFNFNETKYIGVQTSFDLLRIAYENAYVFKMIMDNKDITSKLTLQWVDVGIEESIYNVFIYLAALVCKYHGYEGQLSAKLPYTAAVLGYDFKASLSIIKDTIDKNTYLRSNSALKEKIRNMNITNLNSVDTVFSNMQDIESMLISGYTEAKSKEEFDAYRDLYNTLMTSKIIDEVYTTNNGEVAETFTDLLRNKSPELYTRLLGIGEDGILDELTIVTAKIDELITSLKYAPHSLGIESSNLIENLFRILRFFKSAKAEMIGYNIIYKITMRGVNFFKIMDEWVNYHLYGEVNFDLYVYDFLMYYKDIIKLKKELVDLYDNDRMHDQTFNLELEDRIRWTNDLLIILSIMYPTIEDFVHPIDFITKYHMQSNLGTAMDNVDKWDLVDQFYPKGDPIYIWKDPFEFLDMLILRAALNYLISDMTLEDYLHSISEVIEDYIKLNKESLMQDDKLQALFNSSLKSIFQTYILKEAKAYYSGMTISSHLDMIDKFLMLECTILQDYTNDMGIPGDNSLIEVLSKYKYEIFDEATQNDTLELLEYIVYKTFDEEFEDSHVLKDQLIQLMLPTDHKYINDENTLKDFIHSLHLMQKNKLNEKQIIIADKIYDIYQSINTSDRNDILDEINKVRNEYQNSSEFGYVDEINDILELFEDVVSSKINLTDSLDNTIGYHVTDFINDYALHCTRYHLNSVLYDNHIMIEKIKSIINNYSNYDNTTMIIFDQYAHHTVGPLYEDNCIKDTLLDSNGNSL